MTTIIRLFRLYFMVHGLGGFGAGAEELGGVRMPMPICRSVPGHCCRQESCHAVHVFHPKSQASPASNTTIIRLRRLYFIGLTS